MLDVEKVKPLVLSFAKYVISKSREHIGRSFQWENGTQTETNKNRIAPTIANWNDCVLSNYFHIVQAYFFHC